MTTGLRERKKSAVRHDLLEAALTRFGADGYERTTVREIADSAGVSTRTFNRYFSTKEDVVLAHQDELLDDLLGALESRPPTEPPLAALRAAFVALLADPAWDDDRLGRVWRVQTLIAGTPALLAADFVRWESRKERLAQYFADRADAPVDFRLRLLASTAFTAVGVALREWAARPTADRQTCVDLITTALGSLGPVEALASSRP